MTSDARQIATLRAAILRVVQAERELTAARAALAEARDRVTGPAERRTA